MQPHSNCNAKQYKRINKPTNKAMSTKTITIKSLLVNNTSNEIETMQQNVLNELNKIISSYEIETGLIFDSIQFNENDKSINVTFKDFK